MSCFYFLLLPRHLLSFRLIAFFISFPHFRLCVLYHVDLCALYNLHAYTLHPSSAVIFKNTLFQESLVHSLLPPFLIAVLLTEICLKPLLLLAGPGQQRIQLKLMQSWLIHF